MQPIISVNHLGQVAFPGGTGQDGILKSLKIEDIQRPRMSSTSESKKSDEVELPKTWHAAERSALLRAGIARSGERSRKMR